MRDLYDYDDASYEECINDLNIILENLSEKVYVDSFNDDTETLERYGERIKNIARRLKEIENENI